MPGPVTAVPRCAAAPGAVPAGAAGAAGGDAARGGAAAGHLPTGQARGFDVGGDVICEEEGQGWGLEGTPRKGGSWGWLRPYRRRAAAAGAPCARPRSAPAPGAGPAAAAVAAAALRVEGRRRLSLTMGHLLHPPCDSPSPPCGFSRRYRLHRGFGRLRGGSRRLLPGGWLQRQELPGATALPPPKKA